MNNAQEHIEHCKAQDAERKELEDKIKQCDLRSFAILRGESEAGDKFWVVYFQRCDLLRQHLEKYGEEAHQQLSEQLNNF